MNWQRRARLTKFLAGVADQELFTRQELDNLCGQRNKPLGKLLWSCFLQEPIIVGKRNGELQLWRKDQGAINTIAINIG